MKCLVFLFWAVRIIHFVHEAHGLCEEGIVGGELAYEKQFKYQVSLQREGQHVCGGAIINDLYIIAAAHCAIDIEDKTFHTTGLIVLAGSTRTTPHNQSSVTVRVIKIYALKTFRRGPQISNEVNSGNYFKGDIALYQVKNRLGLAHNSNLMALNYKSRTSSHVDETFVVSGYGYNVINYVMNETSSIVNTRGSSDGQLRFANTVVMSNEMCEDLYKIMIDPGQMCASLVQRDENVPEGTCLGDSGSPLVYRRNHLIGVLIAGPRECREDHHPAVYTRIDHYSQFIQNALEDSVTPDMITATWAKKLPSDAHYQFIENKPSCHSLNWRI